MHEITEQLLTNHIIRKSGAQKSAFIDFLEKALASEGISISVEESKLPQCRNIVIGDPKHAQFFVTAHYDTPAALPFPNFITPRNPISLVLQTIAIMAVLAPFLIVSILIAKISFAVGYAFFYASWFGVLIMMLAGPANKSNFNDNTSGVACVIESLLLLPESERAKYCFVLFDLEELGLIGSMRFAKQHSKRPGKILLNMDCISDGDTIMLMPSKAVIKSSLWLSVKQCFQNSYGKTFMPVEKGFRYYPSDNAMFKNSAAIAAFNYHKAVGYYISKLHTKRDKVFDEFNIECISKALAKLSSISSEIAAI
ncbi:MAG: M28 family metallopeptidase [Eubacteriaceae bacterium]|nr:M28 family metallopeptidase [Eubacteriaceae bacterium]